MAEFKGLSQYCSPLNADLAGRSFPLAMDDGTKTMLFFSDASEVQIAEEKGGTFRSEHYEVLKADPSTYFVHIQPYQSHDLRHLVLVLDLSGRLVTRVDVEEGFDPELPRLMKVVPAFGAIDLPGLALPETRHHLTKLMTGEHITWHYNPSHGVTHIYHSPTCIRTSSKNTPEERMKKELASDDPEIRARAEEAVKGFRERQKWYPIYEEPSFRIWINDHLQLFSFVEENQTLYSPEHSAGGGGMIVLQDVSRLIGMGLCFNPANLRYSFTHLLTAYGVRDTEEDLHDVIESPYDNTKHKCMPSNHWPIPEE